MKAVVETVGPHAYQDLTTSPVIDIRHEGPQVVVMTPFLSHLVSKSKLEVLKANLPDAANDVDFQKALKASDGDVELAIDSYISELTDAPEKPAPRKKAS